MKKHNITNQVSALRLLVNKQEDAQTSEALYAFPGYLKDKKLLDQGFKIHISATFLNADKIFDIVILYLLKQHIAFKVIASNKLLRLLNEDRFGYTQVGKFITIYPKDVSRFVDLIHQVNKKLVNFKIL